jgi:bifunctional non-homologous end joining protein LigD
MTLEIRAGRRTIAVPRPDKPLFPCGITKGDLALYYERVAGAMLPHVTKRPLNMERYPDGIEGNKIMQQRASDYFPSWIARVEVPKKGGTVAHVVANEPATLVYLAGQACITLHPWLSRSDRLDRPDRLIIDLDPSGPDAPDAVRKAALQMGDLLRELGLVPWAMATGSKGYHLLVPLTRRAGFDEVREFARDVAALAADRDPETFTVEQRKAKRDGRILIDVLRNAYAHTAVAPYSVRPRRGAPVATPLHWEELHDRRTRPDSFTLRTVPDRLERDGDPWKEIRKHAVGLSEARRKLAAAR